MDLYIVLPLQSKCRASKETFAARIDRTFAGLSLGYESRRDALNPIPTSLPKCIEIRITNDRRKIAFIDSDRTLGNLCPIVRLKVPYEQVLCMACCLDSRKEALAMRTTLPRSVTQTTSTAAHAWLSGRN